MMRKEKAASAGSSSSGASPRYEGANRQRERNGPGNQGAARAVRKEGDQSRQQPREKFSRVKPMAAEPPVHQIRLEDYAPQRPRGQDDLFGTTSLLDVDVASMDQVQGQNAEFVGGEQNVPADRGELSFLHPNRIEHFASSIDGHLCSQIRLFIAPSSLLDHTLICRPLLSRNPRALRPTRSSIPKPTAIHYIVSQCIRPTLRSLGVPTSAKGRGASPRVSLWVDWESRPRRAGS